MSAILFRRQCVLRVWWVPSHSNFTTHQSHRLRHIHNTLWIYKINWCPVKMVAILRYFQIHFGCQNLHILIQIAKNYVRTSHYLNQAAGGGGMHQQIWPGLHTQLPIIYVRETAPAYIHSSRGGGGGWGECTSLNVRETAPAYIHNCQLFMYVKPYLLQQQGGGDTPAKMYVNVKRPRPTYTIANYLCTWNLICFCAWPAQGGPSTAYCRGGECTSSIWPSAAPITHPPRPSHYPTNRPLHGPHTTPPTAPSTAPSTRPHPAQHPLHNPQHHHPPMAPHTTPPSTPSTTPSTRPHGTTHHTLHRAQRSPQG